MKIETQCSRILRPWRFLGRCAFFAFAPGGRRWPLGRMRGYSLGFTLIEILVVVLIIGILGAIALPQYQRALLKSRYAALMPIAKSMANSNEAYYLEHGIYADDPQDLLIQGQSRYTDDTELEFGTVSDYAYVLAKNEDKIPNNTFVVYQKHSGEFPGEIHCEALADNDLAESVCKSFGGNESIGKTLTDGYETYVLFGTGNGVAPTGDNGGDAPEEPTCPDNSVCDDDGNVTGCSTGYKLSGDTCVEIPPCQGKSCDDDGNITECASGLTLNNGACVECNIANAATCSTTAYVATSCNNGYSLSGGACVDSRTNCPSNMLNTTASASHATCTQVCEDTSNPACYKWTGGKEYQQTDTCDGSVAYVCAGSTFGGNNTVCFGDETNGCADSAFTGTGSQCLATATNACAGSTFSGDQSRCEGYGYGGTQNSCSGTKILAGAVCKPLGNNTTCAGALYGAHPDKDPSLIGSCDDQYGYCPVGAPLKGSWNADTHSYDISGWKGGYCDPNLMVSGACPSGSPKQGGGTW